MAVQYGIRLSNLRIGAAERHMNSDGKLAPETPQFQYYNYDHAREWLQCAMCACEQNQKPSTVQQQQLCTTVACMCDVRELVWHNYHNYY